MNLPSVPQSIDDYVRMLEDGVQFSQMNYGDGEWGIVCGWRGENCDGKPATELTAALLERVILHPRFTFVGYNPGRPENPLRGKTETWLGEHNVNVPVLGPHALTDPEYGSRAINIRWAHKEIIPSGNLRGRFGPLIKALRNRALVVVGPDHLTPDFVDGVLKAQAKRLVPLAWNLNDCLMDTVAWVRSALDELSSDAVVSWSLGYTGKVAAWFVADSHPLVTQFDAGAVWDPYSGVLSRSGYRKPEWQEMMQKNLDEGLQP